MSACLLAGFARRLVRRHPMPEYGRLCWRVSYAGFGAGAFCFGVALQACAASAGCAPGDEAPMKLALLSDIHSNRQALHACMEHARAQGAQQFALLGDLVGYGADPVAVVEQAMELAHQGALLVQ